jgi:hypothetical protein
VANTDLNPLDSQLHCWFKADGCSTRTERGSGALASFWRLERISTFHPVRRFGSEFSIAGVDPKRKFGLGCYAP